MSQSPKTQKIPQADAEFALRLKTEVANLNRCYQCSMCSDGCPVVYVMDIYPNQIIQMARLGLKEKALRSNTIWLCASCETCATRCPNDIEIVRLMDVLREESLKEGIKSPVSSIPRFHQAFVEQIRKKGRVNSTSLMLGYQFKTREFLSLEKLRALVRLGLQMLGKGKLKFPAIRRHAPKTIKKIFRNAFSRA